MLKRWQDRFMQLSAPRRDLLLIGSIGFLTWVVMVYLDLYEEFQVLQARYEFWELDELLMACFVAGCCGLVFGVRRGGEMAAELRARRHAEQAVLQMSRRDGLTGLANRQSLAEAFERLCQQRDSFFVVVVDLDAFMVTNNVHGHQMGDTLLCEVARRIQQGLPATDCVGRLGNDEFAILLDSCWTREAVRNTLEQVAALLEQPIIYEGTCLQTTVSMGVSRRGSDGRDMSTLLRRADLALRRGRVADGRGQISFFDLEIDRNLEELPRTVQMLREGLEHDYFTLVFQPIMDLFQDRIVGFEALARMHHPQQGPVSPAAFILAAEECGLMTQLTDLLLHKACAEVRDWPEHLFVSFNLSALDLRDTNLPERIGTVLETYGLTPSRLEVEVTETAVIRDIGLAQQSVQRLQAMGIRVAMDDFGIGYSSLAQISRFTFDKIKIDQEFISALLHTRKDERIVRLILSLGRSLNMQVVAEGVEQWEQLDWLLQADCHYGQGFYIGRPMSGAMVRTQFAAAPERPGNAGAVGGPGGLDQTLLLRS